ncbi:hypothetical protein L0451_000460 [Salmonella enterica]|nr:hypothetical protein [Salmonella enterica]EJI6718454.1 hypothetical protein [Salmonella enterica]
MTATAYYNEIDPFAAAWLQNLIDAGCIAPGVVDTRSIEEVTANDLKGFTQCHFFAGIGVWRNADWLFCRDGKWRPVKPGLKPLVNGLAGRVGQVRAYGNAIVAPVAETFIRAYMEAVTS